MADKDQISVDDDVIAIPSDEIQLGHDTDGMPMAVPGTKAATGKAIEDEDGGEPARERTRKAEPSVSADEIEAARRDLEAARREAAESRRLAEVERAARAKAEDQAGRSTEFGWRAHWAKVNADAETMDGYIASTQSHLEAAERDLQAGIEANDASKISQATRLIARLEGQLDKFESGKAGAKAEIAKTEREYAAYAEAQKAAPAEKAQPEPDKTAPKAPTPDEWIATHPRKTQEWLRSNKEYVTDPAKHAELMKWANQQAADYGSHYIHSPQFLEALNEQFGSAEDDVPEEKVTAKPKSKVTAAAPVSRRGNTFSSSNMDAKSVKLPPKLAAFVKSSGLDPTQYALGAVADIKAGRLPKDFLDPDYDHQF